jgi:aminocarboxymuconate-semialdehyde decarboxylase
MTVDSFTHINPKAYMGLLLNTGDPQVREVVSEYAGICSKDPNFCDPEERKRDMERYGIDVQVVTVQPTLDPNYFSLPFELKRRLSTSLNDELAWIQGRSGGRIAAAASVAISTEGIVDEEEMERAVKELGLRGFLALTHIDCTPIDRLESFWRKAHSLGAPVFLHPIDPCKRTAGPYEAEYYAVHVLSWPHETAVTLYRLVSAGVLGKYTGAKVIAHHLGGGIPFLWGRIWESLDRGSTPTRGVSLPSRDSVMEGLLRVSYDTAIGGNKASVRCALEVLGPKRLIFATDYPWGPRAGRHRLESYPRMIGELGLDEEDEEDIMDLNARRILRL